jgi:hypothetical protein
MARGSNGALVPTCQLCSANVPETTGHFYTCSGAWAADYPHLWKHRVGAALQELGAARPARAADALWRSLTDSHWSHAAGFYPFGPFNRAMREAGESPMRANSSHKLLRRAMILQATDRWKRREQELLLLVHRRRHAPR